MSVGLGGNVTQISDATLDELIREIPTSAHPVKPFARWSESRLGHKLIGAGDIVCSTDYSGQTSLDLIFVVLYS